MGFELGAFFSARLVWINWLNYAFVRKFRIQLGHSHGIPVSRLVFLEHDYVGIGARDNGYKLGASNRGWLETRCLPQGRGWIAGTGLRVLAE